MNDRLPGRRLHSPRLEAMLGKGILGGQFADGSQKDGFLKYEKGRPAGVYDPNQGAYVRLAELAACCDPALGALPKSWKPWKAVIGDAGRAEYLEAYFRELRAMATAGAELARAYGLRSKEIGLDLVKDKVAAREDDVNTVLLTGFYHAYGPINAYFD
jgi:hypothetical protein